MRWQEKLKKWREALARKAPVTVPLVMATCVIAAFPPTKAEVEKYERLVEVGAIDTIKLIFQNGMFTGFAITRMQRGNQLPFFGLTITTNTFSYNVNSAAQAAGWVAGTKARIWVTVNSAVYVGGSASQDYSMFWSTFPEGADCKLINNGYIVGKGGDGGNGDNGLGGDGKRAIILSGVVSGLVIDNTNGYIFGGAGGGGLGAPYNNGGAINCGGGGGGGGYGYPGGTGGYGGYGNFNGGTGGDGSLSGNGYGADGGYDPFYGVQGADGGNGGYGAAIAGQVGYNSPTHSGGGGGGGGVAVYTNGNTVTWLGGNNSSQVVGGIV